MKFQAIFLAAFSAVIASTPVEARDNSEDSYGFLNIPSSARAYGLGGINISDICSDINYVDQNPALLGPEFGTQVGFNYMRYIASSNFAGVKFGKGAGEHSAWGAGLQYWGYGSIESTDENGNTLGDFSPKDIAVSGTYSRDITDYWRGGVTLRMIYSSYDSYTAVALATDLGVNYYDPERDLSFSVVVANLGGQVKRFDETYHRLPFDIRAGWTQSFGTFPVRFSVTAWNLTKWHLPYYDEGDGSESDPGKMVDSFGSNLLRHLVFAADFIPSERFYVGIGYNYKTRTDMSSYSRSLLSGVSLAAGLRLKAFSLGLAFAQPHKSASTFMVNISTRLSELL